MRELLLLDLAGFRCGVWKEDVLSHKEQNIHWLMDGDGAVTAISMMGAHPVSLADLSYCLGLSPLRRARRYPVLVPAGQDLSVSFVVEHEVGELKVFSADIFRLPVYLQTPFIESCIQFNEELIPLINIRAVHSQVTGVTAAGYSPPTPQLHLSFPQEKKKTSFDSFRVFNCNKKSFAASSDYFFLEQASKKGKLTSLPLLPSFVLGITRYHDQILTVLDLRRYLQLPIERESEEEPTEHWLIGTVEEQGFAFVVDGDQGELSADVAHLVPLPLLVRADWRENALLHARKIISVLDFRELFAQSPEDVHSRTLSPSLRSDGYFDSVFGQQQVEIVEFSLSKMIHALPDVEVADTLPFSHCQRLAGTRGLVAGVTQYKEELLPVLDLARCFGQKSFPTSTWKLLLVCNGDLRALVLAEEVFGKRSLNVSEQRALPFNAPHSSVYGCYPVSTRVGLIFNILALTVYFDDEQARELFLFSDDLLPLVDDVYEETSSKSEQGEEQDDLSGKEKREKKESQLIDSESLSTESLAPEQDDIEPHFDSEEKRSSGEWDLEEGADQLLVEEPDHLVQSVVASMLSEQKAEQENTVGSGGQEDSFFSGQLEHAEQSGDDFPSIVAAMLSQRENGQDDAGTGEQDAEELDDESGYTSDNSLEAASVHLTEEQDNLVTATLATMLYGDKKAPSPGPASEDDKDEEEQKQENSLDFSGDDSLEEKDDAVVDGGEELFFSVASDDFEGAFEEAKEQRLDITGDSVELTGGQESLLQSTLASTFRQEEEPEQDVANIPGQVKVTGKTAREGGGSVDEVVPAVSVDQSLEGIRQSLQQDEIQVDEGEDAEEGYALIPEKEEIRLLSQYPDAQDETDAKEEGESHAPVIIFTEEQNALLQSTLATAFSQENEEQDYTWGSDEKESLLPLEDVQEHVDQLVNAPDESRQVVSEERGEEASGNKGNCLNSERGKEERCTGEEKDGQECEQQDRENEIEILEEGASQAESSEDDLARCHDQEGNQEQIDSVALEFFDISVEESRTESDGNQRRKVSWDAPAQHKEDHEISSSTSNILKDTDAFPELNEFAEQILGGEQVSSVVIVQDADFVKKAHFPSLSSPDPRKIKKKIDKTRKKEREILFRDVAHILEVEVEEQPAEQESKKFRFWMILFLLGLFIGFLLWLFVFRDQEDSRGKSIKKGSYVSSAKVEKTPGINPIVSERKVHEDNEKVISEVTESESAPLSLPVSSKLEISVNDEGVTEQENEQVDEHEGMDISTPSSQQEAVFPEASDDLAEEYLVEEPRSELEPERENKLEGHEKLPEEVKVREGEVVVKVKVEGISSTPDESISSEGDSPEEEEKVDENTHSFDALKAALREMRREAEESGTDESFSGMSMKNEEIEREKREIDGRASRGSISDSFDDNRKKGGKEEGTDSGQGKQDDLVSDVGKVNVDKVTKSYLMKQDIKEDAGGVAKNVEQPENLAEKKVGKGSFEESGPGRKQDKDKLPITVSPAGAQIKNTIRRSRHTVSKGDTLWKISEQYTGSGYNYPDVAKKNKIPNPDLIYPNQQVEVPDKK